jgi:hypothetical protein
MSSPFDETDFVDDEFQASKRGGIGTAVAPAPAGRPPTRDELDQKVSETQQRLVELKAAQEALERERASLEEARRRQAEFHTGREEMLQSLTRGLGLLEQAEFAARRDAEQMTKTMTDLRDALQKLQAIHEETWTPDSYNSELTRALTAIENARMEWNAARLKWPLLSGNAPAPGETVKVPTEPGAIHPLLAAENFGQLCRIGFALTWPLLLIGVDELVVLLLR